MAITDDDGNFRIRGLNPNLHYELKIRNNGELKYIKPEVWEIYMEE